MIVWFTRVASGVGVPMYIICLRSIAPSLSKLYSFVRCLSMVLCCFMRRSCRIVLNFSSLSLVAHCSIIGCSSCWSFLHVFFIGRCLLVAFLFRIVCCMWGIVVRCCGFLRCYCCVCFLCCRNIIPRRCFSCVVSSSGLGVFPHFHIPFYVVFLCAGGRFV